MSDTKNEYALERLRDALADVPEKYQAEVCQKLTHDIGVIKNTISMVMKQAG